MSFRQALLYFAREAGLSLLRSWKISLLAILTITVSLFLAGAFLLVSINLRSLLDRWGDESRVVVYLEQESSAEDLERVLRRLGEAPWAEETRVVSAEEARDRFGRSFPSLLGLLDGWEEEPLPPSIEVEPDWRTLSRLREGEGLEELLEDTAVTMVDDDRDWLRQLQAVVVVFEGLGLILGAVLLLTAIFTISSVIRLTAYLYRDEIAVMRLVGATEFFIRGPFYVEGFFQGLVGGLLAVAGLGLSHQLLAQSAGDSLLTSMLISRFLELPYLVGLVLLGGLAGLFGAITSLRREILGTTDNLDPENWEIA